MKDNDNPMVSVCCLAYNEEQYIGQTLDGILMQKGDFSIEVLIHDDASTDNTANIIRDYQERYPDIIKPIFQRENQWSSCGWGILKKFVYPLAKGEFIALCEGDDYWTDEYKLQRQIN